MKLMNVILVCVAVAVAAVVFANFPASQEPLARATPARESAVPAYETAFANRARERQEKRQENSGGARGRAEQIALAMERALVARDPQQRETAFAFLLPELIDIAPARVIALVARQEPGETRDALRDEVVRIWIVKDREAAVAWIGTLENEGELESAATTAMRTLAATKPAEAIDVADQFGIGRDDGSLEYLVQIWATEKPDEARRWIETQSPSDPRTMQLRARIEFVAAGTYNAATRNGTPSKPD
jgi:hypothetical protein